MSDVVIRVENLGKKYIIGHQAENGRYVALRDVLMQNARSIWHKTKDLAQGKPIVQGDTLEEVWALKDVNFEIRRGEAVGIIGRNGAGKSTLLKVLSRITEPSAGRVTIKGRVASLLEVGTGFHPELTGRENVYLNGAILGMTRAEIKRKFDEIVAFAEVERFLDTPVKRYSSGMYVRLAFAVAAHLEPEILVVDEVLAVGDAAFQKKCLGKMGDVAHAGRTVLFVSHNMSAINNLCQRAVLLEEGKISADSEAGTVVDTYLNRVSNSRSHVDLRNELNRRGNGLLRFTGVWIEDSAGQPTHTVRPGQKTTLCARYKLYVEPEQISDLNVSFAVRSGRGYGVTDLNNRINLTKFGPDIPGEGIAKCVIPRLPLNMGQYTVGIYAEVNGQIADWLQEVLLMQVDPSVFFDEGMEMSESYPFFIDHSWRLVEVMPS